MRPLPIGVVSVYRRGLFIPAWAATRLEHKGYANLYKATLVDSRVGVLVEFTDKPDEDSYKVLWQKHHGYIFSNHFIVLLGEGYFRAEVIAPDKFLVIPERIEPDDLATLPLPRLSRASKPRVPRVVCPVCGRPGNLVMVKQRGLYVEHRRCDGFDRKVAHYIPKKKYKWFYEEFAAKEEPK